MAGAVYENEPTSPPWWRRPFPVAVAASVVGGLIVVVLVWVVPWLSDRLLDDPPPPTTVQAAPARAVETAAPTTAAPTTAASAPSPLDPMYEVIGGCERFAVYSQGRLTPVGAAIRADPFPSAPQIGSRSPNVVISVDAWVRTEAPYPDNPKPWDSDVWFHLTGDDGWVSFAGVRGAVSYPDGTDGPSNGGQPVDYEALPECEAELRGP